MLLLLLLMLFLMMLLLLLLLMLLLCRFRDGCNLECAESASDAASDAGDAGGAVSMPVPLLSFRLELVPDAVIFGLLRLELSR